MKKVLIPIDFTKASDRAIIYTNQIFKNLPMEVILLYIQTDHSIYDDKDIQVEFEEMRKFWLSKVDFEYHFYVKKGELIEQIQTAVREFSADMVIMGTKGSANDALFSNSTALVRSAECPVIVVPEQTENTKIKKIAYANDFKNVDKSSVFKPLWNMARTFGAEVHIVHINQNNETNDSEEEIIEYYLEYIDHEYVCISNPDIEAAINDYIKEKSIDLLVVLPRKINESLTSGNESLIKNLTNKAKIPVLTLA